MTVPSVPISPLDPAATVSIEKPIPVQSIVTAWQEQLGIDVSDEFGGVSEIRLCCCRSSGLRFFWPLIAGSAALYANLEKYPWYYRTGQWEHRFAIAQAAHGWRALDLGCGSGSFVSSAVAAGLVARGVDFNSDAVDTGRARGLDLRCADWTTLAREEPGAYDLVTAFQVLEHLSDPLKFVECATQLVRPGGLLILAVPDSLGWLANTEALLDMPPHHVLRWTPDAMRFLTRGFPLELRRIVVEPLDPLHIRAFAQAHLQSWLPRRWSTSLLSRGLARILGFALELPALRRRMRGQSLVAVFQRVAPA